MTTQNQQSTPATSATSIDHAAALRRLTWTGGIVSALFLGTVGVWAAAVPIAGAVVANGQLVANHNLRKVQHPTGGVVREILARAGDKVNAGDVLLRLDDTVILATLTGVTKKIDELEARAARLNAERADYAPLVFPNSLERRANLADVAEILSTERSLYDARKAAHMLRKQRLQERIAQLRKEHESQRADLKAKEELAVITARELEGLRALNNQRLVNTQRLNAMEREAVTLTGQQAQLAAAIAQTEGRIVETEVQLASLDDELRAEIMKELRETQAELSQQIEKRTAAQDQLQRVEVRAPISGEVHESIVNTIGGVVSQAEPIMTIAPTGEHLELEVRIEPHDIDQVHVGQDARIRLNAFARRTTPELPAKVSRVSPDVSQDQKTGAVYYSARLALAPEALSLPVTAKLQAGMQAEALITTAERTAFDYLSRPLSDQMRRAFRER